MPRLLARAVVSALAASLVCPLPLPAAEPPRRATTVGEAEAALAQLVTIRRPDGATVPRGSAFFIDAFGHLVTCAHVLDRMPKDEAPRLRLSDGRQRRFEVVAVDREVDLALLLAAPPERFLTLATATLPDVGQAVLLAGYPAHAGADASSAPRFKQAGVVALESRWATGVRRTVRSRRRIVTIKVDQIADAGQSGGPLLAQGTLDVVGVVRANLESATGGLGGTAPRGYGAAVPVLYLRAFVEPLLE